MRGGYLTSIKLIVLLAAALFARPQIAYSQEDNLVIKPEVYVDPHQTKIDSLLSFIKPDSPDSVKAKYFCDIAMAAEISDTIQKYALLSLEYCQYTDYSLFANNYYAIAESYHKDEEFKNALLFHQKSIKYSSKLDDSKMMAKTYQRLALVFDDLNDIDSTTHYMDKALDISKKINDTILLVDCYRHLGEIYLNKKLFKEAEDYFKRTLGIDSLRKSSHEYGYDLFLLAQSVDEQENSSVREMLTATGYLQKAAGIFEADDSYTRFYVYRIFSSIYIKLAQKTGKTEYADSSYNYHQKAEKYFIKNAPTAEFRKFYYVYVDYMIFYKRYDEARIFMTSLGNSFNNETAPAAYEDYHRRFKEVCLLLGDYKRAYEHSEKQREYGWKNLNDSTMAALSDAKTQQAVTIEKVEREKDMQIHNAEKRQMQIAIFSLIGGLFLISLLVFYISRVLKFKKKANAELTQKNTLLIEQKEEIETQRDHIEQQSKEIRASINYARRIQRALLTPEEAIGKVFPDYFLLYKPCNVVSGDFYWVGQFGDNKVCIIADCTGHGVPGGFMSVLGMTNLNYIVSQDITPDAILNKLREAITHNLRQSEETPEKLTAQVLDGMDAAVYVVNEKTMTLSFAGANTPLVLIRDNEVQVIKPDRMPVGIAIDMRPFKTITMELRKGDCLYTYSDGFQDQFNYETSIKFQKGRLLDLLLEIHNRTMDEQRELLNLIFKEWRGPAENQTDDVVIMGVRI